MSTYLNLNRVFEYTSPVRATNRGGELVVKTTRSTEAVAGNRTEHEEALSTVLTLDDFGGRSDALGG
jgi:hypothetical protein